MWVHMYGSFFMRTKSWGWSLVDKTNLKILHKRNFPPPHYEVTLHIHQEPSYSVVSRAFTRFALDVLPVLGPWTFSLGLLALHFLLASILLFFSQDLSALSERLCCSF